MTWFAQAEGLPVTSHPTEAEAIAAAEASGRVNAVVWEAEGEQA